MKEDTFWMITLLSNADEITKKESLKDSSFTVQDAIDKYLEYRRKMSYGN